MYSKKAVIKNRKEINFDLDKSCNIAKDFVLNKIPSFLKFRMELVKKGLQDHGCHAEYLFELRSINSPSFVSVKAGPTTGEVISYNEWLDNRKIAHYSKIGKEKAIEIAKNLIDFKINNIRRADLRVWYNNKKDIVPQWIIEIEGEPKEIEAEEKIIIIPQGALIVIDANTSEIIKVSKTI